VRDAELFKDHAGPGLLCEILSMVLITFGRSQTSAPCPKVLDSDSRYLFGGNFGGATEAAKGSRGSDPRLLGLTMGWLLDRTFWGATPCIKDRQCPRVRPTLIILQQDRQLKRLDPFGLDASFGLSRRWQWLG